MLFFLSPKQSSGTVPRTLALIPNRVPKWVKYKESIKIEFDHNDLTANFDLTEQKLVLECTLKTDSEFDY